MSLPTRDVVSALRQDGIIFMRRKVIRLPFTDTHTEVSVDRFSRAIEQEDGDKLGIKLEADGPMLPLRGREDLEELAALAGKIPVEGLQHPQLARDLRALADQGFGFQASLATQGPVAAGLYGAYNALTDEQHGWSGLELLHRGRSEQQNPDSQGLKTLADFYRQPQNAEAAELERAGYQFFDGYDRSSLAAAGADPLVGKEHQPWVRLSKVPAGDGAGSLERLERYRQELNRENAEKIWELTRKAGGPGELAGDGLAALDRVHERSRPVFASFLVEGLQQFRDSRELGEWAHKVCGSLGRDEEAEMFCRRVLEKPDASVTDVAESLISPEGSSLNLARELGEALRQDPAFATAIEWGHKALEATEAGYSHRDIWSEVLNHRRACTGVELAALSKAIHSNLIQEDRAAAGESLARGLQAFPETESAATMALELAQSYQPYTTRNAIYSTMLELPPHRSGTELAAVGAQILAGMDGYWSQKDFEPLGQHFLEKMLSDPRTRVAAQFGQQMLTELPELEDKKAVLQWVLQHPTAASPTDFAQMAQTEDFNQAQGTALLSQFADKEPAGWALKACQGLSHKTAVTVMRMAASRLETGRSTDCVQDLVELGKGLDTNWHERAHLGALALALCPDTPALEMGRQLVEKLDTVSRTHAQGILFENREKSDPEALAQVAFQVQKKLIQEDRAEAGMTALEYLSQFDKTAAGARFGLELAEPFTHYATRSAIASTMLELPELRGGVALARVGVTVWDRMDDYWSQNDFEPMGQTFLKHMADDPATAGAAQLAKEWLEQLQEPDERKRVTRWVLGHPQMKTAADFAEAGKDLKLTKNLAGVFLNELSRHSQTAAMGSWAAELIKPMSEEAVLEMMPLFLEHKLHPPTVLFDQLRSKDFDSNTDLAAVRSAAVDMLVGRPAAEFTQRAVEGLDSTSRARAYEALLEQQPATAEGFRALAETIEGRLWDQAKKQAADRMIADLGQRFKSFAPACDWAQQLLSTKLADKTGEVIRGSVLEHPYLDRQLRADIYHNLSDYESVHDFEPLGMRFLKELEGHPDDGPRARQALATLEVQEGYDQRRAVIGWGLGQSGALERASTSRSRNSMLEVGKKLLEFESDKAGASLSFALESDAFSLEQKISFADAILDSQTLEATAHQMMQRCRRTEQKLEIAERAMAMLQSQDSPFWNVLGELAAGQHPEGRAQIYEAAFEYPSFDRLFAAREQLSPLLRDIADTLSQARPEPAPAEVEFLEDAVNIDDIAVIRD